jgi:acid stress-induced BolA-like protein IbaG/YrbA
MMQPEKIQALIEAGLPGADVYVEGDGAHFTAVVVHASFVGKSRIQKQQLVYDTVRKELLDGTLHALSIQAFTPEEWQKLEQEQPGL